MAGKKDKYTPFDAGKKAQTIAPKKGKASNKADFDRMKNAIKDNEKNRR